MTNLEFLNQFGILYNNITSNLAPGLDDYEISVFLTLALDDVLKAYINPKKNKVMEGLGDSARRDIDFSKIIETVTFTNADPGLEGPVNVFKFLDAKFDFHFNSHSVTLPSNILFTINERVKVSRNSNTIYLTVVPINYIGYDKLNSKPFKRPLIYLAWRISNTSGTNHLADLVVGPSDSILEYTIRYIRLPRPIVLTDLSTAGLSINGESDETSCELDEILHPEILKRAVELAKAAYIGYTQENSNFGSTIAVGNSSATELGILPLGNNNS